MKTAAEIAAESRARQGLPPKVVDPAALDRLATLMEVPAAAAKGASTRLSAVGGAEASLGVSAGPTAPVPQYLTHGRAARHSAAPADSNPETHTTPERKAPVRGRGSKAAAG